MKILFAALSVLAAGVLVGADLTTKSGKVYNDYTITGVTSRGVSVEYAAGLATVPLSELPDDLREKYSAEVAEKKAVAQKKADARKRTAALKRITLVLSGGIECVQILPNQNAVLAKSGFYEDTVFCIAFVDTSNIVDGSILKGNRIVIELWRNPVSKDVSREKVYAHVLYCIGQYQYTTVSGGTKTVPCFTLSQKRALAYLEKHPNAGLVGMRIPSGYHYILPEYEVGW